MSIVNQVRRRSGLVPWLAAAGLVLSLAAAAPRALEAQCTLSGGPVLVDPPAGGIVGTRNFVPKLNSLALYQNAAGYHLVDRYNYGYTVFSLANPTSPTLLSYGDIHAVTGYINPKDGQTNVASVGAAPDGSSILIGYMFAGHGTLVMGPGSTDGAFGLQGKEFGPGWGTTSVGGMRVDVIGSRYIGYMIQGGVGLYAADITSTAPSTSGVYPSALVANAPVPGNTVGLDLAVNKAGTQRYLVYSTGLDTTGASKIVVVNVSRPGSAGTGIAAGFYVTVLDPVTDFGLPAGSYVRRARAAFHPNGTLQILAEATDSTSRSVGIALRTFDPAANSGSGGLSAADTRTPYVNAGSPYLAASSSTTAGPALIATADDLIAFTWETNASGMKLFTLSANTWGTDLTPGVTFSATDPNFFNDANNARAPVITEGWNSSADFFLVTGGSTNTVLTKLTCQTGNTPATSTLNVSNSAPFIGDTVTLTRNVTPAPAIGTPTVLTSWDMDFDYHASNETMGSYPILRSPDMKMSWVPRTVAGVSGQMQDPTSYPASLSFTGPCDPSHTDGANCWQSVVVAGDFAALTGIPSVSSPYPFIPMENEGGSASTVFAFEAANTNVSGSSPSGSVNLATLPVTWKVPHVRVSNQSSLASPAADVSILLGDPLYSAAEGSPLDTGYKWYFGTTPEGTGAVFDAADAGCGGKTCTHTFPSKGTFAYWLTVPYPNGYVSEDYPSGVGGVSTTRRRGLITVSDVVLNITAPGSVAKNLTSFTLTRALKKGASVFGCTSGGVAETGAYQYVLCQGSAAAPCTVAPADYTSGSALSGAVSLASGSGNILTPVPATYPAYYWLQIRYQYATVTGGCSAPQYSYWPSSGTAWPITVSNITPAVDIRDASSGASYLSCSNLGANCPTTGQLLKAVAIDSSTSPATDITDASFTWSFGSGSSPSTATGSPSPTFSYGTATKKTITLTAYNVPITYTLQFVNAPASGGGGGGGAGGGSGGGGGGGGGGTSGSAPAIYSFTASPTTLQTGQTVTFACTASGSPSPTYSINFGGSFEGTSPSASATHTYSTAGTYSAYCTAQNSYGTDTTGPGHTTANQVITVTQAAQTYSAKVHVFVNGVDPCLGQTFCSYSSVAAGVGDTLTAHAWDQLTSANIPSSAGTFAWTFGNATPSSASTQGATFSYSQAGAFKDDVQLTFTPGNGTAASTGKATMIITSHGPAVTLQVQASASTAKIGTPITFTATAGAGTPPFASYTWAFGDGGAGSGASVSHSYAASGTYQVSCIVVDSVGTSKNATTSVTISPYDPVTLQIQATPSSGVIGGPILFSATAGGGSGNFSLYSWSFGDGVGTGTGATATYTYTKTGLYTVTCTVKDSAGPTQTATTSVTIGSVQLWLVPGLAWVSGQGGAEWQSDISIFNPSPISMNLQVAFLDGTAAISSLADLSGKWKTVSVSPNATRAFMNVVSSLFALGKGSYGALLVRGDNSVATQPVVTGSTYDTSRGAGGTVGLSLAAISLPGGAGAGIQAADVTTDLVGLRDDVKNPNHTNLAIANLYSDYVTAVVTFLGPDGSQLGQPVTMQLNPFGVQQLTNALSAAPPSGAGYDKTAHPVDSYRAHIQLTSGTAILSYASVIDDVSLDPILVMGTKNPTSSYRIPGMVRTQGQAGTLWRSDLVIYNASASARSVQIVYSWVDAGGIGRMSGASIPFAAGQIIQWVDFVKLWLGLSETDTNPYINAFVDVSPADSNADPILVTSRVYNNQPTGNVGLGVPGYTSADVASVSGAKKRLILAGLRSDANYRSNVALFIASGSSLTSAGATLKVYDVNGTFLASAGIGLSTASPFIQLSIDNLVANSGGDKTNISVVVENLTGAPISGYATVVDNRSGDGTLVTALAIP